jgi:hypothetical protein
VNAAGQGSPEEAFVPHAVFAELLKRQILIHEQLTEL